MRAKIVRIGNSKGLRLPKPVLDQTGISGDVELEVQGNCIVIRPSHNARDGWESSFQAMRQAGDDIFVDPKSVVRSRWDEDEWKW